MCNRKMGKRQNQERRWMDSSAYCLQAKVKRIIFLFALQTWCWFAHQKQVWCQFDAQSGLWWQYVFDNLLERQGWLQNWWDWRWRQHAIALCVFDWRWLCLLLVTWIWPGLQCCQQSWRICFALAYQERTDNDQYQDSQRNDFQRGWSKHLKLREADC